MLLLVKKTHSFYLMNSETIMRKEEAGEVMCEVCSLI